MKNSKSLNEEINRIKSLFGNIRLYGNITESILLNEQGLGKKLAQALGTVAVVLKDFDPKLLTNFLETEIKDFDDLSRHLNDYDVIWRKIIPNSDLDYAIDMASEFNRLQKKGSLAKIDEKMLNEIIAGLPADVGIRESFLDMWLEAKGKPAKNVPDNTQRSVVKGENGENVLLVKDENNNIKMFEEKNGELIEKTDFDKTKAEEAFGDVSTSPFTDEDIISNTKSSTEPIDPDGNPDVIKGEMIEMIEDGISQMEKNTETPKEMSNKDLEDAISKGGIYVVQGRDGKFYQVKEVAVTELDINESGDITNSKTKTEKTLKSSDTPISDNPKNKTISSANMDKSLLGVLRYLFPVSSSAVRVVRFLGDKTKLIEKGFTKDRFTFFPGEFGDLTSFNTYARFKENLGRLVIEQAFVVYFYGSYVQYKRGDKDWYSYKTFFDKKLVAYGFLVHNTVKDFTMAVGKFVDSFSSDDVVDEWCKNHCETKMSVDPSKVMESPCYTECTEKVKKAKEDFQKFKDEMDGYSDKLKQIGKLDDMDENEIEKFCSGADGKKVELITSLGTLKKGIGDFETNIKEKTTDQVVLDKLIELTGLSDGASADDILNKVLTPKGQTKRISVADIEVLEKAVNDRCISWYEQQQGGEMPIEDQPNDTDEEENSGSEEEMGNRMVYINMSITPVELTGEDVG